MQKNGVFRKKLLSLTFARLQRSVYITPHNFVEDLREWIDFIGLKGKVRIFRAEEVTGDEVKFIVGGTHLIAYSPEKIKEIVSQLDFEFIAPCHCTGLKAEFLLMEMLGDRFKMVGSGSVIEI